MSFLLYSIASSLHKHLPDISEDAFIREIETSLGEKFTICDDISTFNAGTTGTDAKRFIYVRTGGTEGIFRKLDFHGDVRLLASGKSNSLAAAMEILAYVNRSGGRGEILHGNASGIAARMRSGITTVRSGRWMRPLPQIRFNAVSGNGMTAAPRNEVRLGVIGAPSDWLISSGVSYEKAGEVLGIRLIDIGIDELIGEIRTHSCDLRSFEGSVAVYESLRVIVERYALAGVTLRCFDLLDTIGNTGCLALARLNAEGTVAACEGDIPALITMMIAKQMTGCPGFQCNLSRISGDELLFAHCTVPLSMVSSYSYATHFESGIGTAIKGELPPGDVTILKVSPDLDGMVAIPGVIVRNQSEPMLCRTQIVVRAQGASDYFLGSPLANHHIIVPGTLSTDHF